VAKKFSQITANSKNAYFFHSHSGATYTHKQHIGIYIAPPCKWILHLLQSTEDPVTIVTLLVAIDCNIASAVAANVMDSLTCLGYDCSATSITDRKSTFATMWNTIAAARITGRLCSVSRGAWGKDVVLLHLPLVIYCDFRYKFLCWCYKGDLCLEVHR